MSNSKFQDSFFSYVEEVTPGTTPGTPSMKKLRTKNPLNPNPNKSLLESEEVLSHRQREHVRHGMRGFSGNVPTDFSFGAYNDMLAALLSGVWEAGVLKVGSTQKTFTVEQKINADKFIRGLGVTPSQLSITILTNQLVTCGWDFVGMDFSYEATSLGTPADVATHPPFDGLGGATIEEGGSAISIVTSLNMTINASKSVGGLVGTNKGDVPTDGQVQVTGNLTARFNSLALFSKFEDETESSLKVTLINPADSGDTLEISLPRLKYNSGSPQNNGNVIDVSLDFEGLYDVTAESSIVITEVEAA